MTLEEAQVVAAARAAIVTSYNNGTYDYENLPPCPHCGDKLHELLAWEGSGQWLKCSSCTNEITLSD